MADKRIGELPLIEDLDDESFFVAEQQGAAGHITGAQIKGFAGSPWRILQTLPRNR